jgi:hypothetical protein
MFGLIKKIFKLVFPIILGLVLAISLPLYFLSQRVTDRENTRTWLKTDEVRDAYQDYITKQITEDSNLSLLTILIPEDDISELIKEQINEEWVNNSIDLTIDSTYDWLEGKEEAETPIELSKNTSDNNDLQSILQPSTGDLAGLLGLGGEDLLGIDIPLLDLNEKFIELLPKTYNQLTLLPNRLLILNGILLALLVFSSKNGREASFKLGLTLTLAGGILLFGPDYIGENPESLAVIGINLDSIPQVSELPVYAQQVVELAQEDITNDIKNYTIAAFVLGVVFIILSQLELKEVEVWDGMNSGTDEYEDGEESEDEE